MTDKPFAPACERNRDPILAVLRAHFADRTRVLEIGSGTGQHAVYFAAAMPYLVWQTSDVAENLPGIRAWLDEAALPNTPPPLELDVDTASGRATPFDAMFSANTLHIMSWPEVETLFARAAGDHDARREARDLRPVQLRRRVHERQQCGVRRIAEGSARRTWGSATSKRSTRSRATPASRCSTTSRCRPTTARWSGSASE